MVIGSHSEEKQQWGMLIVGADPLIGDVCRVGGRIVDAGIDSYRGKDQTSFLFHPLVAVYTSAMRKKLKHSDKLAYFKYMPVSSEAVAWGSYVTNAGFTKVAKNCQYPPYQHPSDHHFTWDKGRILNRYQILYIESGSGVFESSVCGTCKINAGDAFVLFPGVWHRYKPDMKTGWSEYWLEFSGEYINGLMKNRIFTPEKPVMNVGYDPGLIQIYKSIFDLIRREPPDYQLLLGAKVVYFIAYLLSSQKKMQMVGRPVEDIIAEAKRMLLDGDARTLSLNQIASKLKLSFTVFRRLFKTYTGFSPRQFELDAMIIKAKGLLKNTNMPVGMIAEELGMESIYYFSRLFHKKTGMSPMVYRQRSLR